MTRSSVSFILRVMRRRLTEAYRNIKHLKLKVPRIRVRADDCFLVSWPRSGNTWMRFLVLYAIMPDHPWDIDEVETRMPSIARPDLTRVLPQVEQMPRRLFKSHDPFLPFYLKGRVAYMVRHGQDAMVSYYHYQTGMHRKRFTWRQYLDKTLAGRYTYGSWHEHVAGWIAHRDNPNVLVVRYEDMLEDAGRQLGRVLSHFQLSVTKKAIAQAVERADIRNVNRGFQQLAARKGRQFSGGLGGGAGRSKHVFSQRDADLFMQYTGPVMKQLGYSRRAAKA